MSESTPHSEHVERLHIALSWVPKAHYPEARDALNGLEEQLEAAQRERDSLAARLRARGLNVTEILDFDASNPANVQGAPSPANGDAETSGTSGRPAPSPASEPEIEWVPVTVVNEHGEKVGPQGMWRPKEQAE